MPISRVSLEAIRSRILTIFAAFALICGAMLPAAAQQTFQFDRFAVEGNQRIEPQTILSLAELPAGQAVSAGQVNAALQNLLDSGFFEDVELVPRGNTLVIRVQERPTISRVNVEGNRRIDDEVILAFIQSRARQVYVPELAEEDARLIVSAYEESGRFNATVTPSIIRRGDNRVDLVFEVIEGDVVEIERISFVGNKKFSDRRLRRVLSTKQAGLLRQFVNRDTFIADRISFDRQLLTDFYRSRGYIDFTILDVTNEFSRERNATFITFNVREGQEFDLGKISVSSTVPEVDAETYSEIVRIKTGQTYSPVAVQTTIDRLEKRATDNQLDFISVVPVLSRNDRNLSVDVDFQFVRAPRIFVERIDIEGNTTTLDRVIRQQFDTVEGDPFNPREIQRSSDRIRALGFFETANVETRQGSSSERVVIDVDVVEQPTGSLSFGASYSIESGIGFAIGFSERNFLGRGQSFGIDIQAGTQNQNSRIDFTEPFFLGRDLAFGLTAFYEETDFNNVDFNTRRLGFGTSLTYPLNDFARFKVGYELSQDTIFNVDPGSSPILQNEAGTRITSAVSYDYIYDTRRGGLDPLGGVLVSFGQEWAGLGGDNNYVRTTARVRGQRDILNEEVNLRGSLEAGALNFFEGDSRVIDRFFTSSNVLRGFASRGVGPRDLNAVNTDVLAGNYLFVASVETEFPIGLPEEYGIRGGVFFNAGSVWGLDNTDGAGGVNSVDDSFHIRSAIGFSIFWNTPIGPLRLDFSRPIERLPYDEVQDFNLSLATEF
jgi:outer membrane protein insertion porin family